MTTYMRDLAARREALVVQSATQRALAGQASAGIRRGLVSVDRAAGMLRYLARKPLVLAFSVVAMALLVAKPRRAITWLGYGLTAYTMFRRARRALSSQGAS
jgi:YqjK-like protein